MIIIKIDGECVGKGRPRFRKVGNFVSTYTPKDTLDYENLVKVLYLEQNKDNASQSKYFDKEPLYLEVNAYYEIPKSFSKKKRIEAMNGLIYPTKKPDFDNVAKIICDALNKVAYSDDTQIVSAKINKYYNDTPYVEVVIKSMDELKEAQDIPF